MGDERQQDRPALLAGSGAGDDFGSPDATVVVLPSLTFPPAELDKIVGITFYEERLLCLLLLLAEPRRQVVYVTATRMDPAIVDYHLGFLPDPADGRRRLHLVALDDPAPRALSAKLLEHPEALAGIRAAVRDAASGYLLPFNVTPLEQRIADLLGLPLHGPHPDLAWLGTKSSSRRVARRAGVAVLEGCEDLRSIEELDAAITRMREVNGTHAVVVKLNEGFSGQGNAVVRLDDWRPPVTAAPTVFCAESESWSTFAAKLRRDGAVVERLLDDRVLASPSVQLRIQPGGPCDVISTHDQVLGGPHAQVYLGCRFPAAAEYRPAVTAAAAAVGEVLRAEGVVGAFGIDFFVRAGRHQHDVYLSEINLRLGGTTHPYWMARLLTGGRYDVASGELVAADGTVRTYVASDNLRSPRLVGAAPRQVLDAAMHAGVAFDPATGVGATFHLLGAVRDHGKLGATCIARSAEEAEDLYRSLVHGLATAEAGQMSTA